MHEIDFSKADSKAVYRFAENLARSGKIATIKNKSFFYAVRKTIDTEVANDPQYYEVPAIIC